MDDSFLSSHMSSTYSDILIYTHLPNYSYSIQINDKCNIFFTTASRTGSCQNINYYDGGVCQYHHKVLGKVKDCWQTTWATLLGSFCCCDTREKLSLLVLRCHTAIFIVLLTRSKKYTLGSMRNTVYKIREMRYVLTSEKLSLLVLPYHRAISIVMLGRIIEEKCSFFTQVVCPVLPDKANWKIGNDNNNDNGEYDGLLKDCWSLELQYKMSFKCVQIAKYIWFVH